MKLLRTTPPEVEVEHVDTIPIDGKRNQNSSYSESERTVYAVCCRGNSCGVVRIG